MKNYRTAFQVTAAVAAVLAAALIFFGWRYAYPRFAPRTIAAQAAAPSIEPSATSPSGEVVHTQLAPIELSPQRMQSIGVTSAPVEVKSLIDKIRAVGNVAVDQQLQSYVQTRFSGWIRKVYANSNYQYVRKGQPLFTIYSPKLVTTEQEYLLAKEDRSLLAQSAVPGVAKGANSLLSAARDRLRQWGIPEHEIKRLEATGKVERDVEIDAPASGYVTERNALPNLYAQPSTQLYTITGLGTVWVDAEVFESDLGQISVGDPASVTTDAYPGRTFHGHVDFVYPNVDMTTRTAKVRLVFSNPGTMLKPGMFVNVDLRIPLGYHLAIPASGVFQTGTRSIVFVDHGGGYLEPREVTLGPSAGNEFVVLQGLKPGERVVTSANFLIDSESQLQAALGSYMPPPPGAGEAARMNGPATPQADIEFSTSPSPPAKGSNTFRAKLTLNNSPVVGAQVTVTFFMPAMTGMGMPAMRTKVNLADQGGGVYQGSGTLETGGAWQVTIIAQKGGETLATKQFTLNAGGGM